MSVRTIGSILFTRGINAVSEMNLTSLFKERGNEIHSVDANPHICTKWKFKKYVLVVPIYVWTIGSMLRSCGECYDHTERKKSFQNFRYHSRFLLRWCEPFYSEPDAAVRKVLPVGISHVLPIGSAGARRGLSNMNNIFVPWKSHLTPAHVRFDEYHYSYKWTRKSK